MNIQHTVIVPTQLLEMMRITQGTATNSYFNALNLNMKHEEFRLQGMEIKGNVKIAKYEDGTGNFLITMNNQVYNGISILS